MISLHQVPEIMLQDRKIESLWMAVSIVRGDGASCCRKGRVKPNNNLIYTDELLLKVNASTFPFSLKVQTKTTYNSHIFSFLAVIHKKTCVLTKIKLQQANPGFYVRYFRVFCGIKD